MKKSSVVMAIVAILFAFVGAFASTLVQSADQTRVDVSLLSPCNLDGTCIEEAGPICEDANGDELWLLIGGTCPGKCQGRDFEPID